MVPIRREIKDLWEAFFADDAIATHEQAACPVETYALKKRKVESVARSSTDKMQRKRTRLTLQSTVLAGLREIGMPRDTLVNTNIPAEVCSIVVIFPDIL